MAERTHTELLHPHGSVTKTQQKEQPNVKDPLSSLSSMEATLRSRSEYFVPGPFINSEKEARHIFGTPEIYILDGE